MEKITQSNNLSSLETELSLTKAEMEEFRKLPKEEQDKQKDEKLEKLKALQERLDQAIQEAIKTGSIEEVKILKETLNKEITDLEYIFNTIKEIQVNYTYTNEETGKIERQETITMDIEKKLEEFISFYKKTNIDLPADFEETIKDIWERNQLEIEQSIQEKGFDDLLIIPGNISLADLSENMKMENGIWESANFKESGSFTGAKSQNIDKPRIILFHKKTLPEVQAETGLDVHLNITGGDALKLFEQNPNEHMTLNDFMIMERRIFEETGKHISDYKKNSGQWLNTKSGAYLVNSYWRPGDGKLYAVAFVLESQASGLGVRPSHVFF